MQLPDLLDHLLHVGLGPIVARDNPNLYPFVLAIFTLLIARGGVASITLVRVAVVARRSRRQQSPLAALTVFSFADYCLEFALITGGWLAFATPLDRLPFDPPAASTSWFGLFPAPDAYVIVSVLAHGVLSIGGAVVACVSVGLSMPIVLVIMRGRSSEQALALLRSTSFYTLLIWSSILLAIGGWEIRGWPWWLIVPAELFVAYRLPFAVRSIVGQRTASNPKFSSPAQLFRREQLEAASDFLATILLIGAVMITHVTPLFPVALFGIYAAMTFFDDLIRAVIGIVRPRDGQPIPLYWKLTLPVVLAVAFSAAGGWLDGVISNVYLTPTLWLEAGAAAGAYALFRPLVVEAEGVIRARERQQETEEEIPVWMRQALAQALTATYALFRPVIDRAVAANLERERQLVNDVPFIGSLARSASTTSGTRSERPPTASTGITLTETGDGPAKEGQSPVADAVGLVLGRPRSRSSISQRVRLPTFWIFCIAAVAYHYLLPFVSAVLDNGVALLIFSLLPLLAGLLPILNKTELDFPRYVLLLFIYAILAITGIDALFVVTQVGLDLPPVANGHGLNLFADPRVGEVALHLVAQELLVLVTLGQLLYLFVLIEATLFLDVTQARRAGPDPEGWLKFGDRQAGLGKPEQAIKAYDQVLRAFPDDVEALRRKSLMLYSQNKFVEALEACTHACELARRDASLHAGLQNLRGDILTAMGQLRGARSAYQLAVDLDGLNITYWNDLGSSLSSLGLHREALSAFEAAIKLDEETAFLWRNKAATLTYDLGQQEPERHAEALAAIDRAIALDRNSIRAWTIRGHALKALGRIQEAQSALERALSVPVRNSGDSDHWDRVAEANRELGRHAEALAAIDRAIEMAPEIGGYHATKGEILLEMGCNEDALMELTTASKRLGGSGQTAFTTEYYSLLLKMARALRALGREAEAQAVEAEATALRG